MIVSRRKIRFWDCVWARIVGESEVQIDCDRCGKPDAIWAPKYDPQTDTLKGKCARCDAELSSPSLTNKEFPK